VTLAVNQKALQLLPVSKLVPPFLTVFLKKLSVVIDLKTGRAYNRSLRCRYFILFIISCLTCVYEGCQSRVLIQHQVQDCLNYSSEGWYSISMLPIPLLSSNLPIREQPSSVASTSQNTNAASEVTCQLLEDKVPVNISSHLITGWSVEDEKEGFSFSTADNFPKIDLKLQKYFPNIFDILDNQKCTSNLRYTPTQDPAYAMFPNYIICKKEGR
jgi:hypothetical protein